MSGPGENRAPVPVHHGTPGEVRERALVLDSCGIPYGVVQEGPGSAFLLVGASDAEEARHELGLYETERRGFRPVRRDRFLPGPRFDAWRALPGALAYSAVLLLVRGLEVRRIAELDWAARGILAVDRVLDHREWYRCVTALTLHADATHLAGNLVFGLLFGCLLTPRLGAVLPWSLGLVAGTFGNALGVFLKDHEARSLGASTTVFAILGVGAAVWWHDRRHRPGRWVERAAPLVVGAALLGILGAGGPRTDALGHALGFGCGVLSGLAAAVRITPDPARRRAGPALVLGVLSAFLLAGSWFLAATAQAPS